ncbi:TPA: AlpA family phage regulatory protein [Burkholderia vietnamiensis]|uniref:AlpA family phage regulatory protein n=1 Tax=Burkholderia vietnamiensis TaxID=60552 RepID=A0AA44Y214_BURVI|nr:AlpA family phage regulatory protein [Burkholderia vietnamiensis]MCA8211873.1 AlpA family phage regulatory protein [Burkholderia vietnamiensis]PRH42534.1 AlpA family phage regulatory protein [Burkholderia vietnamiensis]HDR9103036.1 AlpA family phage regulatory protein [Burkholderia vietnamiensis]HDR9122312.1 AlpA family phage regulatory protein [Burkholderia vietnamiensis]HDR9172517.1 AlpA family phage regulatory protein [Burkholderia vietnamiensis]
MRALRMKDVSTKVGLGQSRLSRMIAAGAFPQPFEIVPGRTAWLESAIDAWLAEKAGVDVELPVGARRESDRERLDELARKIASRLTPHALWDLAEVAEYLHRSEQHTRQWIITQDGFPRPIRIPSGKSATERARPLWRAKDVIAWAESHIEE